MDNWSYQAPSAGGVPRSDGAEIDHAVSGNVTKSKAVDRVVIHLYPHGADEQRPSTADGSSEFGTKVSSSILLF